MNPLRHIMKFNDLGHPLCANLREGTWAMDYVYSRLERWGDLENVDVNRADRGSSLQATRTLPSSRQARRMVQRTLR